MVVLGEGAHCPREHCATQRSISSESNPKPQITNPKRIVRGASLRTRGPRARGTSSS